VAEGIAQEMHRAALPWRTQHLGHGLLEALVGVGDDQLDPGQAAADQAAQELPPERLGLGRAHLQADDLPLPAGVDPVGDHQSMVLDPPAGPDLLHLGVQPQIRVGARQGPLPEHGDLLVQPSAEPRHLVLGHSGQPERLHQPVHLTGGHAIDVGLLDHRDQRLLAAAARHPVAAALAVAGASPLGDLGLHQLLGQPAHGLAQPIGVLVSQHLAHQLGHAHPAHVGHRGAPLVGTKAPTILSPRCPTYRPPSQAQ
jgi:hypothetical protein